MAPDNRPRGREKNIVQGVGKVEKHGPGLDSKPLSGGSSSGSSSYSGGSVRAGGGFGMGKLLLYLIVAIVVVGGGLFGLGGSDEEQPQINDTASESQSGSFDTDDTSAGAGGLLGSLIGGYMTSDSDYSSYEADLTGAQTYDAQPDMSVAPAARQKFTSIIGQGADMVTVMVYLCGTDLESRSGMATADLQEMASAKISENVRIIVYTGGCKKWKNSVVSSKVNQIYEVREGGIKLLEDNMGQASMSDPATLTSFIKYCTTNYPANRNELILWDHGSGSLSGYAYDEKYPQSGSMSLSGIQKAIADSGTKFDFVGFDACLMATVETALMLSDHADYMIASEETEPGVGWYYTNWISKLSADTGMPTVEIGKNIIDDFVGVCEKKVPGQKATLSVTDLAEVAATVPEKLNVFSKSTAGMIGDVNGYLTVSKARDGAKEFAQSSKLDQIDFIHFANLLGTPESNALADVLKSCVKYNRCERNIRNANGLSIYFPYKKVSKTGAMVKTYEQIGMDSAYSDCIRAFAANEQSGQMTNDGEGSPLASLFGSLYGSDYAGSDGESYGGYSDALSGLMTSLLTGRSHTGGLNESKLKVSENSSGQSVFKLSEEDWSEVSMVDLNVFVDDGEGFIELGLDNTLTYDNDNNLIAGFDNTWMSINGHVVPYYHTDSEDDGDSYSFNGYVPALLNGDRVELLLAFTDEIPGGTITGARYVYDDNTTDTVAKNTIALKAGDKIEPVCKYYDYNGNYQDSYRFGDPIVLDSPDVEIGNINIGDVESKVTYVFTDIYQQQYWSPVVTID